jgi:hypothetical protein
MVLFTSQIAVLAVGLVVSFTVGVFFSDSHSQMQKCFVDNEKTPKPKKAEPENKSNSETLKRFESKNRTALKPEKESAKNNNLKTEMPDTPTDLTKDDDKLKAEKSPVSSHNCRKETSLSSTKLTTNGDNKLQTVKSLTSTELRKLNFPPIESVLLENNTATLGKEGTWVTDEKQIVSDVRFSLDFAILGHSKCATSFIT